MKKKIFTFIAIIFSIFKMDKIYAQTDTFYPDNWIPNIFIRSESSTFLQNQQARITRRKSDGQFVYCIEHGPNIIENVEYIGSEEQLVSELNISKETLDKVKTIAYYGYGYENHTDDKWYAITQVLIWRTIYPEMSIYYTDTFRGNKITAFENEEREIMNLVNNHFILPSFSNNTITMKLNDTVTLTDTNNILSNYEVESNNNIKAKINDNNLNIKTLSNEFTTIKLKRKTNKYNRPMLIWKNDISQDVIMVGNYDTIEVNLNVDVYDTNLKISKIGEHIIFENNGYKYENVSLKDVVFNFYADEDIYDNNILKYKKDELISELITDENGNINISNLYYGKYKLVETKSSLNNILLEEPIYFELNEEQKNINMCIENKLDRKVLKFKKIDSKTSAAIENTEIEIYTSDDKLIYKGFTNKDGLIIIEDLFVGKYYIKEVKASEGYQLSDNIINFEITNDTNEPIIVTMTNEVIEDVPNTYKNENMDNVSLGGFLIIMGIYGIKNKKKL